jgi:predicted DsbA family dithiol-disulfide isomerase
VRVERLADEFELEFDPCAFDLKPGIPPEGLSREQVYAGRVYPEGYLDNMRRMAADAGLDMKRPPLIPNTRKAHEATEFAREHGAPTGPGQAPSAGSGQVLLAFHRALFHAYWTEERNIGDVDVLCDVAAGCGMDADALGAALADGRYAPAVEGQMTWSRAVGVTGVPTVIFEDRFAVVGAQEYATFLDVARRVVAQRDAKSEDSG